MNKKIAFFNEFQMEFPPNSNFPCLFCLGKIDFKFVKESVAERSCDSSLDAICMYTIGFAIYYNVAHLLVDIYNYFKF